MKNKRTLFIAVVVIAYIMVLFTNFMPAIKYPDLRISPFNLLISVIFFLLIFFYSFYGGRIFRNMMLIGFIGGLAVSVIQYVDGFLYDFWLLDSISSVQYPLYILYVAPLFGLNLLMGFNVGMFSFVVSIVFLFSFIVSINRNSPAIQKKPL